MRIYALRVQYEGEQQTIPLLLDNEKLAKQLADQYAEVYFDVGDYTYEVLSSEVDWQPYPND